MANHLAIYSFSQSLAEFLGQSYAVFKAADGNHGMPAVTFDVLSTSDFSADKEIKNKVTLYLRRVTTNNQLRNVRAAQPTGTIGLDLHYLLTIWLDDALSEQTMLGWVIRELHCHSYLDASSLSDEAGWALDETVSIAPVDLSTEDMSRIWEAGRRGYRLSYPFAARIVRLQKLSTDGATPVVATRFDFSDRVNAAEVRP